MKVVDEKGKLFGKLNIIDLLVIVLIVAVAAVVGVKFLGNNEPVSTSVTKLTYTVRVTAQDEALVEQIAAHVDAAAGKRDQLMASGALVNGYVVDCWIEPTRYNRLSNGSVEMLDAEEAAQAGLVDLCFKIEVSVESALTNEVGTQEVRIGKTHNVKTAHFEFMYGTVESCVWGPAA